MATEISGHRVCSGHFDVLPHHGCHATGATGTSTAGTLAFATPIHFLAQGLWGLWVGEWDCIPQTKMTLLIPLLSLLSLLHFVRRLHSIIFA